VKQPGRVAELLTAILQAAGSLVDCPHSESKELRPGVTWCLRCGALRLADLWVRSSVACQVEASFKRLVLEILPHTVTRVGAEVVDSVIAQLKKAAN
jgi:hypothetical protein